MLELDMRACNRDDSLMVETVEAIGWEEKDGEKIKHELRFVIRTLTAQEARVINQLKPRMIWREHRRVDFEGNYLKDSEGKVITETEGYAEKPDAKAPGIGEAQVIMGMGGNLRGFPKSNKEINDRFGVGWFIDGEKQPFSHDVWDNFAFPDELKGELMLAAGRVNTIGEWQSKK